MVNIRVRYCNIKFNIKVTASLTYICFRLENEYLC